MHSRAIRLLEAILVGESRILTGIVAWLPDDDTKWSELACCLVYATGGKLITEGSHWTHSHRW
jgi:hypothetical protein